MLPVSATVTSYSSFKGYWSGWDRILLYKLIPCSPGVQFLRIRSTKCLPSLQQRYSSVPSKGCTLSIMGCRGLVSINLLVYLVTSWMWCLGA